MPAISSRSSEFIATNVTEQKKHEGGLRLDVRRRAMLGGDSGLAIVPKAVANSGILNRVTSNDDSEAMPPEGPRLTAKQITLLSAWIEQGARWPDALAGKEDFSGHWSFRPVERPVQPSVEHRDHVRNPIDAFVLLSFITVAQPNSSRP